MKMRTSKTPAFKCAARGVILIHVGLALLVVLSLSGCASAPVNAEIPVAVPCPPPPAVARPALPIADLIAESPPDAVMRAYAATVQTLMGYARELELLLNGYRTGSGRDERK